MFPGSGGCEHSAEGALPRERGALRCRAHDQQPRKCRPETHQHHQPPPWVAGTHEQLTVEGILGFKAVVDDDKNIKHHHPYCVNEWNYHCWYSSFSCTLYFLLSGFKPSPRPTTVDTVHLFFLPFWRVLLGGLLEKSPGSSFFISFKIKKHACKMNLRWAYCMCKCCTYVFHSQPKQMCLSSLKPLVSVDSHSV